MHVIRKATTSDLEEVCKLYDKTKEWMKRKDLHHWDNSYESNYLLDAIQNREAYLLIQGKKIIGCEIIDTNPASYYTQTEMNLWQEPKADALYLSGLTVDPDSHGRNHAKKMLSIIDSEAKKRGIKYIRLDASNSFQKLARIYLNNGYEKKGEMKRLNHVLEFFEKEVN